MTKSQKIFYGIGVLTSIGSAIGITASLLILTALGFKIKKGAEKLVDVASDYAEKNYLNIEVTPPAKEEPKLEIVQDDKPE